MPAISPTTMSRPRMAAIYAPGTVRARRWHGEGDVRGHRPSSGWTARADLTDIHPITGVVGALVITRWSWGLMQDSGSVLLDAAAEGQEVQQEIREAMEPTGSRVADLHLWQVGPGHFAAIISLMAQEPKEPAYYKALLAHIHELSHVTVEVQRPAA